MKKKKKNFSKKKQFRRSVVIFGEMIKDKGEDYYVLSEYDNNGLIGVFDGCGGSGARVYTNYAGHTGAYISSRCTAQTVKIWFDDFCANNRILSKNTVGDICIDIENKIYAALRHIQQGADKYTLKGSILKDFPTTASIICYNQRKNGLYSAFFWCGDSRGYALQRQGLIQITEDDIDGDLDAFLNLKSDGQLTNVIAADGNFILHGTIIECKEPTILITATDGAFGYFQSPMEFEYMLLDTLMNSSGYDDWYSEIDSCLSRLAEDDYTVGIYIYGFNDDFNAVKDYFFDRKQWLHYYCLSKWDCSDENGKRDLWNQYKSVYYSEVR